MKVSNVLRHCLLLAVCVTVVAAETPQPPDVAGLIRSAEAWLLAQQRPNGAFIESPRFVLGVSELSLESLLASPSSLVANDPRMTNAAAFVRGHTQPDGGIYLPSEGLAVYGTGIGVMALRAAGQLDEAAAKRARDFLFGLQNLDPRSGGYGGIGYDGPGAEDLHNTAAAVDALRAAGVPASDPRMQAVLHFLSMCQDLSQPPAGTAQPQLGNLPQPAPGMYTWRSWTRNTGGAVLRPTASDPEAARTGGAEDNDDRRKPEAYASITYTLLSTYIALDLTPDDPRVAAALGWIRGNWRLDANPGMPAGSEQDGLFYSFAIMARSLDLAGVRTLTLADGRAIDWRMELMTELARRAQRDDAGRVWWVNSSKRWGEGIPQLATTYALSALKRAQSGMSR